VSLPFAWTQPWHRVRQQALDDYGQHVGQPVEELPTPALLLAADALDRNIATMAAALAGGTVALRPHTKVQKSPDLALRQIAAGAVGITVATVWEAAAMAAAGVGDLLVANQVLGRDKVRALAALAGRAAVTVAVDDAANIADLSAAATAAGAELGVLVDLDVGMARCGARSPAAAVALADAAAASPGLRLAGIQAYEGHCMLEPDPATRLRLATEAMDYAAEVSAAVTTRHPEATTVSGGGTGTYRITGQHPAVTELQSGSYVFMDAFHGDLVDGFEKSLTVLSTVVARHGDTVILDAGRKSIGIDFVLPPILGHDYVARYYAEEHALFDTDPGFAARPGDLLRLVPGYAPTTVNLYDVFHVVRNGRVEGIWPVFPRGPGHHGLLAALCGDG
jgi:D-serine deaminase-like pyridoxal phosphate-dependent protein